MRILQFRSSPSGGTPKPQHSCCGLSAADPLVNPPPPNTAAPITNESRFFDTRPTATPRPNRASGVQEYKKTTDPF